MDLKEYLGNKEAQASSVCQLNIINPEKIKDLDVSPLVHNNTMKYFRIDSYDLNRPDILGEEFVPQNTTMTIEIAQLIADILQNTTTLNNLEIRFDNVPSEEIRLIAEALKNNTTVSTVRITRAEIEDEDFAYIMDVLQSNHTLTEISFPKDKYELSPIYSEYIERNEKIYRNKIETIKNIASGSTPENPEEYIEALKFYQSTNFNFNFNQTQENYINKYIQENFFHITRVCKNHSEADNAISGNTLPQYEWDEIFSYLKISDVVEPALSGDSEDAIELLSGITDDADLIGS